MAIETHARFIEDAQKAGHIDTSSARDLVKLYKSYQGQGLLRGIEQVAVEHGFLTGQQVQEIKQLSAVSQLTQIGPYQIIKKLGSGGMAEVFQAKDSRNGKVVALKVLHHKFASDQDYLSRFYREAQAAAKLHHPNIIQAYEAARTPEGQHYLAIEFVEGTTLKSWLEKTKMVPERESVKMGIQIAKALEHAQSQNIVHRDVKPDNIMVTKDGRVKLTDLGLAKQGDDNRVTEIGVAVGTPQYISPEQARGDGVIDVRSDIYSLGATLYHATTGHPPFEGSSAAIIMVKHLNETPRWPLEFNPDLSEATAHVIMKMLAKAPADRYQSPKDLLRDMSAIYHGLKGTGSASMSAVQPRGARSATLAAVQSPLGGDLRNPSQSSINLTRQALPSESSMANLKTRVRSVRAGAKTTQSKFVFLGVCVCLVTAVTIFSVLMPRWPRVLAGAIGLAKPLSEEDDDNRPIHQVKRPDSPTGGPMSTGSTTTPPRKTSDVNVEPIDSATIRSAAGADIQGALQQVTEFVKNRQFIAAFTLINELKAKQSADSKGGFSEAHLLLDQEEERVKDASRPYFMSQIDAARLAIKDGNMESAAAALADARKLLPLHKEGAYAQDLARLEKQLEDGVPAAAAAVTTSTGTYDALYKEYSKVTAMVIRKEYDQALHFLDTINGARQSEVELWKHGVRGIQDIFQKASKNTDKLVGFTHRIGPVSGKVIAVKDGRVYLNTGGVEVARPLNELTENQQLELAGIKIGARDAETQAQLAALAFFRGQKGIAKARFETGKDSTQLIAKLHDSLERMESFTDETEAEALLGNVRKLATDKNWREARAALADLRKKYGNSKVVRAAGPDLAEFDKKIEEGSLTGALSGDARLDDDILDSSYTFKTEKDLKDWWYAGNIETGDLGLRSSGDFWLGHRVSYNQIEKLEVHFKVEKLLAPERAFLAWGIHAAAQVHIPTSMEDDLPRGYFGFFKSLHSGRASAIWTGGDAQKMIASSNNVTLKPALDYVLSVTREKDRIAWSMNGDVFLKATKLSDRPGPRLVILGSQMKVRITEIRTRGEVRSSWLRDARTDGQFVAEQLPVIKKELDSGATVSLLHDGLPKLWSYAPGEWTVKDKKSRWANYYRAPSMRLPFKVKDGLIEGAFDFPNQERRGFEFAFRDDGGLRYALRFVPSKLQVALVRYRWDEGIEHQEILKEAVANTLKAGPTHSFRLAFKGSRIQVIFNRVPIISYDEAKAVEGEITLDSVHPGRNSVYYFSKLTLQNLK